jgi:hypothetical protein
VKKDCDNRCKQGAEDDADRPHKALIDFVVERIAPPLGRRSAGDLAVERVEPGIHARKTAIDARQALAYLFVGALDLRR